MEEVLDVYHRPRDPACPLVCLDETSKQLIKETRVPIPARPGRPARTDYEYERNGTANIFMPMDASVSQIVDLACLATYRRLQRHIRLILAVIFEIHLALVQDRHRVAHRRIRRMQRIAERRMRHQRDARLVAEMPCRPRRTDRDLRRLLRKAAGPVRTNRLLHRPEWLSLDQGAPVAGNQPGPRCPEQETHHADRPSAGPKGPRTHAPARRGLGGKRRNP
jgi:hypothetical protein